MGRKVTQRTRLVLARAAVACLTLLTLVSPARSASDLPLCTRLKYHAVVRAIQAAYACEAHVIRGTAQGDCRQPLFARLADDLAEADRVAGPCPGTDDAVLGGAVGCQPFLRNGGDLGCRLAKLRAAGVEAVGRVRCYRASVRSGEPLDECFARLAARFLVAYGEAERRTGFCGDVNNGTVQKIQERVAQCAASAAIPLSCGNGHLDPGEQCDGQPFCTPEGCGIFLPQCCSALVPPQGVCSARPVEVELCGEVGGFVSVGFCPEVPCPGDPFPGCTVGVCSDPPIASTSVCCQDGDSCTSSSADTTLALRSALLACANDGGTAALGTCAADGRCVRE